ncbi:MAG: CBS domain-containing protein [Candidatus Omnitrophota bacterium]
MSSNLNEKYKEIFGKVEDYLQGLTNMKGMKFYEVVEAAGKKNRVVRAKAEELKELGDIRNKLSHGVPLIVPTEEAIKKIEDIYLRLVSPPSVLTIAIKNVYTCEVTVKISAVIKVMKEKLYTHVPVYKKGKFLGLFSERVVTCWVASFVPEDEEEFIIVQNTVGELEELIQQDADNEYRFVSKNLNVYDIEEMFFDYIEKGRRLGAVFITENGKKDEGLLGIITAWDLPKIKKSR